MKWFSFSNLFFFFGLILALILTEWLIQSVSFTLYVILIVAYVFIWLGIFLYIMEKETNREIEHDLDVKK